MAENLLQVLRDVQAEDHSVLLWQCKHPNQALRHIKAGVVELRPQDFFENLGSRVLRQNILKLGAINE